MMIIIIIGFGGSVREKFGNGYTTLIRIERAPPSVVLTHR
jgi:hypothetical protein